jgi:hypothetical protein
VVKKFAGIITASVLRRCNCAASVCPKCCTWRKASLADFLFSFYFAHFLLSDLCSHWFAKKALPLVGWSQKYLSGNYCDFLMPTYAVTQKINTNIWPLRNITKPTCWDSVKMCYRRKTHLCSSRDGVHWGTVKDNCRQKSTSEWID